MAKLEPEVIDSNIRKIGCPYEPGTTDCVIWLQGYLKGCEDMRDLARGQLDNATENLGKKPNGSL